MPAYVALRKQMRLSVLWLTAIVSVVVPLVFLCGFPGKQIDYVLPILLVAGVAALTLVLKWTGWRAAIALLLLVLALTRGTAGMLATGIRPISREEIRGGLAPLTDHCGRSHKVCRVLWSDCLASAGEYFLDRELGIDTRWTRPSTRQYPPSIPKPWILLC
ncbi:MAG: hypothetical protein M5R36_03375 [Deltaproteobacteria bacterium]|nr:hypothetical protein [Deltaproteobacteria bacterium]